MSAALILFMASTGWLAWGVLIRGWRNPVHARLVSNLIMVAAFCLGWAMATAYCKAH